MKTFIKKYYLAILLAIFCGCVGGAFAYQLDKRFKGVWDIGSWQETNIIHTKIIQVDGCQYIVLTATQTTAQLHSNDFFTITHKGDCNNPLHYSK